jgi:hypothetical protein
LDQILGPDWFERRRQNGQKLPVWATRRPLSHLGLIGFDLALFGFLPLLEGRGEDFP